MNDTDAFYLMVANDLLTAFCIKLQSDPRSFPAKKEWLANLPKAGAAISRVVDIYTEAHPKWWLNDIEGVDNA